MQFERKVYAKMLEWRQKHAADTILFLEGARRTGKTTLAEKLGAETYRTFIRIGLREAGEDVKNLFLNGLLDLDTFFAALELIYETKLCRRESLIILDDVQCFPAARQALKALHEDGRFDYLATGNLAWMARDGRNFMNPSEEVTLNVTPMDFEEFLWAQDDRMTLPFIRSNIERKEPFKWVHNELMKRYCAWMFVGGMPEAVEAFTDGKDFAAAHDAKCRILDVFRKDMAEQRAVSWTCLQRFFNRISEELAKTDKRYVFAHISPSARQRDYAPAVNWLTDAQMVHLARNTEFPESGFAATLADDTMKVYLCDTGLLAALAAGDAPYLKNPFYKALLLGRPQEQRNAMLLHNAMAQCLTAAGQKLLYLDRRNPATRKPLLQADFLVRSARTALPVKVAGEGTAGLAAFARIKETFGRRIGEGIVLHAGDVQFRNGVWFLPYYAAAVLA